MTGFSKVRTTVNVDGQDLVLAELSALDFASLVTEEDEQQQALEMLSRSIESPQVTALEVGAWPKRIVDELLATVAELNGFASGN